MNATEPATTGDEPSGRSRAGGEPAPDSERRHVPEHLDDDREPPSALVDAGGPTVDLIDRAGRLSETDHSFVTGSLAAALAERGASGEIRLCVVSDQEMAEAHGRHLGDATTTDVLTFDLGGDPEGPLDVDAVVCVDVAERSAAERDHPLRHELLLYALHAALHCLGFDDTDDESSRAMHAEEDRLLRAIGVGDVFAREASS